MAPKPITINGYSDEATERVMASCRYVTTKLGDYKDDIVVVGGLVPYLIVDQSMLGDGQEKHVGSMDLDLGLKLAVLTDSRYMEISERLRSAGLQQNSNAKGNPTSQQWVLRENGGAVEIDFLIPATKGNELAGSPKHLEKDFAAIRTPGLELAFIDNIEIPIGGTTTAGEKVERSILVCGPAAFIVLKALAFRNRGENKDAYDIYYVLKYFGESINDVVAHFERIIDDENCKRAIDFLKEDFAGEDYLGPMRAAEFLLGGAAVRADAYGLVSQLLGLLKA